MPDLPPHQPYRPYHSTYYMLPFSIFLRRLTMALLAELGPPLPAWGRDRPECDHPT